MRVLKILGGIVVLLAVVLAGLWIFGPREPIDTTVTFEAASLGADLDADLAASEAAFDDIVPGVEKRIIWAGAAGEQTDFAVVYLHGFSAASEEIRPVPDNVATALGANLYFARLAGHGRDADAMSEPAMNDWIQDYAQALEIGRRIGKKVLLLTTSTGGTLAISGSTIANGTKGVAGIVLISPNFGPVDSMAELANWPLARTWVPALVGEWREWEPHNAQQAKYWNTRYQNVAALPMMALVKHARTVDLGKMEMPALVLYSKQDAVVSALKTEAAMANWGGDVQLEVRVMTPEDTPSHHVIAGDIMSPSQTDETVELIVNWARSAI